MKKRAIIYTRVSTDDQADKGYSLPYQEERLRKYCDLQNITIVAHFIEDHSAKTFNRPEFTKLLLFCKKNRGDVDILLFLNWSRFSRNTEHTYAMIGQLRKLGVEPQAVEQPLDLTVPENKMMLAFYITAPEVENDRRSLNVSMGMRRAKKEGRWITIAPFGYQNKRDDHGKAYIVPDEKNAQLVREAFREFATGNYEVEILRRKLYPKGLKLNKTRFPLLLRNKVYIAKIFIEAYKDEPSHYASAIHEPLIDEKLFYSVQDIIEGRAHQRTSKTYLNDNFFLRGNLRCRRCGKIMTASTSKGNGGKYYYYHCIYGCPERFPAKETNAKFESFLSTFQVRPAAADDVYQHLLQIIKSDNDRNNKEIKSLDEEITKNSKRIQNAKFLMLDSDLSPSEYKEIKLKCEQSNEALLRRKANLQLAEVDYIKPLQFARKLLTTLNDYYLKSNVTDRQLLVGSMFPEKIIYEDGHFRTKRINNVISAFCLSNSELGHKKSGREEKNTSSSTQVNLQGFKPRLF